MYGLAKIASPNDLKRYIQLSEQNKSIDKRYGEKYDELIDARESAAKKGGSYGALGGGILGIGVGAMSKPKFAPAIGLGGLLGGAVAGNVIKGRKFDQQNKDKYNELDSLKKQYFSTQNEAMNILSASKPSPYLDVEQIRKNWNKNRSNVFDYD